MARLSGILRLLAAAVLCLPGPGRAQSFGVAGSPMETIEDRDYLRLFTTLKSSGIDTYFPTFQYQEVPQALSLGYEIDFLPPLHAGRPCLRGVACIRYDTSSARGTCVSGCYGASSIAHG